MANFYLWMVPSWRQSVVERRGPLLGFGFAFAAAAMSAIVDALTYGTWTGVGLFLLRFLVVGIPFLLPHLIALSPYPHRVDVAVILGALLLPILPGFSGTWARFAGVVEPGFLSSSATVSPAGAAIGPGHLLAFGLVTTYFYGVRFWTAAPLDWRLRSGDVKSIAKGIGAAIVGALIGRLVGQQGWFFDFGPALGSFESVFLWLLLGPVTVSVFEELVFRGLIQAGIPRWIPKGWASSPGKAVPFVAAIIAAALHGAIGFWGLSFWPAFGFSLGIGLTFATRIRFLPTVLAHGIALTVLFFARIAS